MYMTRRERERKKEPNRWKNAIPSRTPRRRRINPLLTQISYAVQIFPKTQRKKKSSIPRIYTFIPYRLHKNFKYMISNNTIKTEKPSIDFYYEDIVTYLKKQNTILELPKNSRKFYKQYETNTNTILKQDNHTGTNTHHVFHGTIYGKAPTNMTGQKTTTFSTYCYIL